MQEVLDDTRRWLLDRWLARWSSRPELGRELIERYAEPTRVYHDLRHLRDVLQHLDEIGAVTDLIAADLIAADLATADLAAADLAAADLIAVELAAWFHDAVYDVWRVDNEASSAALARTALEPWLPPETVTEVARLVALTAEHAVVPGDTNGAVLCDADLAVLASEPARYDAYAERVRQEYSTVPAVTFRAGRAAVLQRLLDLPSLFHTSHGRAHWEAPARANLTRELTSLTC